MIIYTTSDIGLRENNEDNHTVKLNSLGNNQYLYDINMFGVYDGHGGTVVSSFLKSELPKYFINKKITHTFPVPDKYVKKVYNHVQEKLKKLHLKDATNSGSTCLVVLHYKINGVFHLQIFNTGDSRAIVCKNGLAIPLTKDHKPNWPEERARIEKINPEKKKKIYFDGYDWRIGDLSVSRAFGDLDNLPYITHEPEISNYQLTNDSFLVLACDGLWDVLTNQEVANFILEHTKYNFPNDKIKTSIYKKEKVLISDIFSDGKKVDSKQINIAEKLAKYAIAKGSFDNVTIIIVMF